ncbi:MAG: hypothetical protein JNN27_20850 [Planctomycetes bacterium]|nr:hypothetical protein [Planctomycetota bacterium]
MKLSRLAALAGAVMFFPVAAGAQSICTVTTGNLATVSLSPVYGRAVHKLRAGPVLGAGRNDLVALTDYGRLVLVRDGLALESVEPLAENIVDFTIAHVEGVRAQVVAIGSDGLVVGTYNASGGSEPTLKFSTILATSGWNSATMVDAASEGGLLQIVAAHGGTLLRATFNPTNEEFVQSAPATVPSPIQFLAAADFYSDAGVEVAVGSSSMLHFYKGLANPTVAIAANPLTPLATASFIDVQRIPKGADVRDSVGVLQRHPATDVFYEVTSAIDSMTGAPAPSAPIASGGLRHAAMAYAPIGLAPGCTSNCTPTDLVFVATTSETLIFQGDPQAAGGMQFSYDAAQLSALDLGALVGQGTPSGLSVAAGDLDGDGDGDLAYAAEFGSPGNRMVQFVLVRNDCATVNANDGVELYCLDSEGAGGGSTPNQVRVGVGLRIPTPPSFPERPNRAQVTIYVREYSPSPGAWNPDISPEVLYSAKFDVSAPTQPGETRGSLDLQTPELDLPEPWYLPPATPPAYLTDGEVLLYVRVTPILELAGSVDLNGPALNFVGSTNPDLLEALCYEIPLDELYTYCIPEDGLNCASPEGAPLINEIHRRKRIRPIGTPPQ